MTERSAEHFLPCKSKGAIFLLISLAKFDWDILKCLEFRDVNTAAKRQCIEASVEDQLSPRFDIFTFTNYGLDTAGHRYKLSVHYNRADVRKMYNLSILYQRGTCNFTATTAHFCSQRASAVYFWRPT
jgi:hypothetical protein